MIQYLYLGRVPYDEGLRLQAEVAALRLAGRIPNLLLLLEHPPVLTLGRNANRGNVLAADTLLASRGVTLHEINRGGDVTYHGPGQLVGYPIFDLRSLRGPSGGRMGPVDFVRGMEEALIRVCAPFAVPAGRIPGLTGVWCGGEAVFSSQLSVVNPEKPQPTGNPVPGSGSAGALKGHDFSHAEQTQEEMRALAPEGSSSGPARKIAAIGIHVSRGIVTHGFAFNLNPSLADFDLIVPCGIRDHAVTSLAKEAAPGAPLPTLEELAHLAAQQFAAVFCEPITVIANLAALRAQAEQQFPAEDTPLQVPDEVDRLHAAAERPIRA